MPRKKRRPIDTELFGEGLIQLHDYAKLVAYISENGGCWMSTLRERFRGDTAGSMIYHRVARLERGKIIKVRSNGTSNYLEVTPRGKELLEQYA